MRSSTLCLCFLALALGAHAAPRPQRFSVDSPTLDAGGEMPVANVFTRCGGDNVSPALRWSNPPRGTRSFAVTLFDPDAPGGFWHWIAYNIGVGAHGLNTGAGTPRSGNAPGDTVQLRNDFGNSGYSGPCPPPGKPHRYVFTVYALDVATLGPLARLDRKSALAAIERHAIAKATLTVTWGH